MIPSTCVICGSVIEKPELVRHLPRFMRCPHCTGYFTSEKFDAAYPSEYFTEEPGKPRKCIFSPLLGFFLWLRMRKILKWTRHHNHPSYPLLGKGGEAEEDSSSPPRIGGEVRPRILDYGCGNGKLVAYLRQKGFDADGYDPEPSAVALALKAGLPVFSAVPDKKYALIMLWHSLEHSETPLQDILALKNYVAPRGRLLIAVPNGDSLEARFFGESFFCYDWPFHRVHFTPKALAILLRRAGFRLLTVNHFNPEYTVSSLVQTFLNLFLPKNAFYSFVSARRQTAGKGKILLLSILSLLLVAIFSPILALFFLTALFSKKTAAFITTADKI